jgi:hypothetical protein
MPKSAERAIDEMGIDWRTMRERQSCKVRPFVDSDETCGNAGKRFCYTCGTRMCDQCTKTTYPGTLNCEVCHHAHFSND